MSETATLGSVAYRAFHERLWKWKANGQIKSILVRPWPHYSNRHVAQLLGYKDGADLAEHWKTTDTDTMWRLCGPHGFALYKVLLAQRGMMPEEEDK
jgi:hypothetical protein